MFTVLRLLPGTSADRLHASAQKGEAGELRTEWGNFGLCRVYELPWVCVSDRMEHAFAFVRADLTN